MAKSSARAMAASAAAVVLMTMLAPEANGASARPVAGALTAPAASTSPAVPKAGHFHVLRAPKRIVSASFAAGSARTVAIAGHAGLPAHGIRALAVTVTVVSHSGQPEIWIGSGASRPAIPTVAGAKGTTSAFAIVALPSSGKLRIWNGARASHLTVDVTGWFSARSEGGTAGLFTRLAGRQIATTKVGPHKARSLTVRGKQGVPKSDVGSLLIRLRTVGAKKTGLLGIAASSAAARTTTLEYGVGTSEDLAVTALSHKGKVVVRNFGSKPVTVALDAMGWFTAGKNKHAFGDVLSVATGSRVLSGRRVGQSAVLTKVTDAGGIPAVGVGAAPTVVLVRALASAPTKNGSLSVEPDLATTTRFSALQLHAHSSRAGLELALPGTTNQSDWRASAGKTTVSAQTYAWFSGGTVVAKGVHVLSAAVASKVTGIDATSVTFQGSPAALAGLKVGDVLIATATARTPLGLLRKVTGLSTSGGNLIVSTTPASLHDAIVQGTVAVGSSAKAPKAPKLKARTTAALIARGHTRKVVGSPSCSAAGAPAGIGATITCALQFNPGGVAVRIAGSAGVALTIDGSISPFSGAHVKSQVEVSTSASASVDATQPGTVSHTFTLGHVKLGKVFVDIAGVPFVFFPYFAPQLIVSGTYDVGMSGHAELDTSFGVSYDTTSGFGSNFTTGGSGDGSYNGQTAISVRGTFAPALVVFIDDDPWLTLMKGIDSSDDGSCDITSESDCGDEAGVYLSLSPWGEVDADKCSIRGVVGIDLSLAAKLSVWDETLIQVSHSFTLGSKQVFEHNLANCAIWSGQILFKAQNHQSHTDSDGTATVDLASRSEATLSAPGHPPIDDVYAAKLSGSGASVDKDPLLTSCGGFVHVVTDTRADNWGGKITQSGSPLSFSIESQGVGDYSILQYVDGGLDDSPGATAAGINVDKHIDGLPTEPCALQTTTVKEPHDGGSAAVFGLIAPPALEIGSEMTFHLATGKTHVKKTVTTDPGANAGIPTYVVTLDLTKKCSKGGTHC